MSASPIRPKLQMGALATVGTTTTTVAFQYNPEQVVRRLEPQVTGGDHDRTSAVRFLGAATEHIDLQLHLSATDGLEAKDATTVQIGIANRLAELELMAYPTTSEIARREALLDTGSIEVLPELAPLNLLVLGKRTFPVRLLQLTITERAYDPQLNPIRAEVALSLRVLTYSDVLPSHPAYQVFLTYQKKLEDFATRRSGPGASP